MDVGPTLLLTLDFGMFILIWMVQLVVYPAFLHFDTDNFRRWHTKYTGAVTLIVLPLMTSQLVLSVLLLVRSGHWSHGLHTLLVLAAWVITFLRAVPLHQQLDQVKGDHKPTALLLLSVNKYRVILWTACLLVSIYIGYYL